METKVKHILLTDNQSRKIEKFDGAKPSYMRIKFIHRIFLWILLAVVFLGYAKIAGAYAHIPCDDIEDVKFYTSCKVYNNWDHNEISAFYSIVQNESSWIHNKEHYADYPKRTATGLMGFLDSTWKTVDCEKTYDKRKQIECGVRYIEKNYGTPTVALEFHSCIGDCYNPHKKIWVEDKDTTWY